MYENVIVEQYEFDKPVFHRIDSITDICFRDCHIKYLLIFDPIYVYVIKLTNNASNEIINRTISDKNMSLYELNENLKIPRENGFIFHQINILTEKLFSNFSHINIHYYLKLQITIMHRGFTEPDYIQLHCNDRRKPFHFACRKWYLYNSPQF